MTEHVVEAEAVDDTRAQFVRAIGFLRRARRFWRTAAVLLVLGAAACAAFFLLRHPKYRSETVLLYTEGVRGSDGAERPDMRSAAVRLKEILQSRALLDVVVREFDLFPEIRRERGAVDAVDELRKHIEFRAPGGDTFSIAFSGLSPTEAQGVTARLAALVIHQDSELRKTQAVVERDFLEAEKKTTEARLQEAETALASFLSEHPRFALDATPLMTGAAIRAGVGEQQGPDSKSTRQVWRRVVTPVPGPSSPPVAEPAPAERDETPEEARAKAALVAARAHLADLLTRFTVVHPDVQTAQAEVERATKRVRTVTAAAEAAYAARARTPSASPAPKPAPRATTRTRLVRVTPKQKTPPTGEPKPDLVALETEWMNLTRSVTEARRHQDEVGAALFKANTAVASESSGHGVQVSIIDPAFLPQNAVPPGRTLIAALFALGSLALGISAAFARALLDDRIYDARDVRSVTTLLVEVPRPSSQRTRVST